MASAHKWNQEDCNETNATPGGKKKERKAACNFSDVRKRKEMAYAEGEDGLIIYTERPTGANAIINGLTYASARALIRLVFPRWIYVIIIAAVVVRGK